MHELSIFERGKPQQFFLSKMEMFNWGGYSALHSIEFSEEGHLITGANGSGKSSIVDAHSAVLQRADRILFNKASDSKTHLVGNKGDSRSWMSYLRGQYGTTSNEKHQQTAQYLREEATWSAITETFKNEEGIVITLGVIAWIPSNTTDKSAVERMYIVAQRPFSINEINEFDFKFSSLKTKLTADKRVRCFDSFSKYAAHWTDICQISDWQESLNLLHQGQSIKAIPQVDAFIRKYMLSKPSTFDKADSLTEHFQDLKEAHDALMLVIDKDKALMQISQLNDKLLAQKAIVETLDMSLQANEMVGLEFQLSIHQQALSYTKTAIELIEHQRVGLENQLSEIQSEHSQLSESYSKQGGDQLLNQEAKVKDLKQKMSSIETYRTQYEKFASVLSLAVPTDEQSYNQNVHDVNTKQASAHKQNERIKEQILALSIEQNDDTAEKREYEEELSNVRLNHTNINRQLNAIRSTIAQHLNVDKDTLPFVAELIQVKEDEAPWRGAIERALHPLAQRLIIPKTLAGKANKFINDNHLGINLTYFNVDPDANAEPSSFDQQNLPSKLDFAPSIYSKWLRHKLASDYNFICMDDISEFNRCKSKALTRQGLLKTNRTSLAKNDRFKINDRTQWKLSFSTAEKEATLEEAINELDKRISERSAGLIALKQKEDAHAQQREAFNVIKMAKWADLDIFTVQKSLSQATELLGALKSKHLALESIKQQIDALARKQRTLTESIYGANAENKILEKLNGQYTHRLQELSTELDSLSTHARTAETLKAQYYNDHLPYTIEFEPQLGALEASEYVHSQLDIAAGLIKQVNKTLQVKITESNNLIGSLNADVRHAIEDFIQSFNYSDSISTDHLTQAQLLSELEAIHQHIKEDGLPNCEERFTNHLNETSTTEAFNLITTISDEQEDIVESIEDLNSSLKGMDFRNDSYIEIDAIIKPSPDFMALKGLCKEITSNAIDPSLEESLSKFKILDKIVKHINDQLCHDDNPNLMYSKDHTLDVRKHFSFMIIERARKDNTQIQSIDVSSEKSGGEKELLSAALLAASLRYKLTGAGLEIPPFAPVWLDEAFMHSDSNNSDKALRYFTQLGFQPVLITPSEKVQVISKHIRTTTFVFKGDTTMQSRLSRARLIVDALRGTGIETTSGETYFADIDGNLKRA